MEFNGRTLFAAGTFSGSSAAVWVDKSEECAAWIAAQTGVVDKRDYFLTITAAGTYKVNDDWLCAVYNVGGAAAQHEIMNIDDENRKVFVYICGVLVAEMSIHTDGEDVALLKYNIGGVDVGGGGNADMLDGKHASDFAAANHKHSYNDLNDKPTIPTIPDSLPANGGNADTVGGKHASDFAAANHKHSYNDLNDKPTIPTIPDSLPANGGNADTVGGKTADQIQQAAVNAVVSDVSWLDGYNIPILRLTGDTTGMTKENAVTLNWAYNDSSGTCTLKWQGASSLAYDKKNFTIKFKEGIDVGWGAQKKYCLKANFIDHSHARNVVSAKLWGTLVASRSHVNATMAAAPNYGAVDGFPCAIVLNGTFQGLYTWNIPKDAWMANMGSGSREAILCASNGTEATAFKALPTYVEDDDLEIEYVTDEEDVAWVKESANRLISLIMNSTGYDMDTEIAKYLDWESAIDYYLFIALLMGQDNVTKNYLLLTYDGVKWYFGAYDMDGTFGLKWNGKQFERANSTTALTMEKIAASHRVFELIKRFKTNALKARWAALRSDLLSEGKIDRTFENFVKDIPYRLYFEDLCRWASVPSTSVSNIDQILRWLHLRLEYMDEMVDNLPAQETPAEPEPEMVNWVPLSTDTDGSLYNGIGYKDDTRLSSSGTVSGTPQAGSVTTGFIPVKVGDVVRIKGGIFLNAPSGHYYFCLYNSEKTKMECVNAGNVAGYPQFTFSYDEASGITTVTLGDGGNGWEQNIAFFRTNVYGNGAELIVTVNEDIA